MVSSSLKLCTMFYSIRFTQQKIITQLTPYKTNFSEEQLVVIHFEKNVPGQSFRKSKVMLWVWQRTVIAHKDYRWWKTIPEVSFDTSPNMTYTGTRVNALGHLVRARQWWHECTYIQIQINGNFLALSLDTTAKVDILSSARTRAFAGLLVCFLFINQI